MEFVLWAVVPVVLAVAALAGAGRFGEMPDAVVDQYVPLLPDRPLTPDDLRSARFGSTARLYQAAQVDRLLARAALDWESERAGLRGAAPGSGLVGSAIMGDDGTSAPTPGAGNEVAPWQR